LGRVGNCEVWRSERACFASIGDNGTWIFGLGIGENGFMVNFFSPDMKNVPKDSVTDTAVVIDDVPVGWVPTISLSGGVISLHPYVPGKTDPTMSTRLSMMIDRGKLFVASGAFGTVAFDLGGSAAAQKAAIKCWLCRENLSSQLRPPSCSTREYEWE
jgi:hypothetical protein